MISMTSCGVILGKIVIWKEKSIPDCFAKENFNVVERQNAWGCLVSHPGCVCCMHTSCPVCVCVLVFEKKKIFKTLSPPNLMLKSFLPSEPFTSAWMHCLYLLAYLNWKLKPPCNELDPFFTLSIFTSVKKKSRIILYISSVCCTFLFLFFFNKFLTCTMDVALAFEKEQKVLCRYWRVARSVSKLKWNVCLTFRLQ